MPQPLVCEFVGHVLLLTEVAWIIMWILVAVAISQLFHQLRGCVSQMQGHRLVACFFDRLQGFTDAHIGRIALGRCSQIDTCLCQSDACLGPSYLHNGVKGCIG